MLKSKHYKILMPVMLMAGHLAAAHGAVISPSALKSTLSSAVPVHSILAPPVPVHSAPKPSVPVHSAPAPSVPVLPTLNWQTRSDWVNVKTDVTPAAVGDGVHDDTQAIQNALNRLNSLYVNSTKTVYFPPGTYRITNTLSLTQIMGTLLIGTGRTTRIVWDGPLNQSMFRSNGATRARYVGLIWDGANKAGVGIDHQSHTLYESRIRHQDEAFLNFRVAGIRIGMNQIVPTAEVIYRNCLFQNSGTGVSLLDWNDYNNDFDGCDFRGCGTAINCVRGNVYVRECHFERSSSVDILLCPHSSSIRRCTSIGSAQFLSTSLPSASTCETTVQDCHVDSWTGSKGAMNFALHGPDTVFDCSFTHPPDTAAPIRLTQGEGVTQMVILSNNTAPSSSTLLDLGPNGQAIQIPAGTRGPCLSNPSQTFFQASESVSGTVLDVKTQFGAKGDGHTDDTAAITQAIAAAKKLGGNAIVYLPPGLYNVSSTIPVNGGGYTIGGSGYWSLLQWVGAATGTIFAVQDPQGVTMEQLRMTAPDAVACIQQTSTNGTPSKMTYDGVYVTGFDLGNNSDGSARVNRGLECIGLSAASVVRLVHSDGSLHFTNCSAATILGDFTADGVLQVDGAQSEKSGFLGFLMRGNAANQCDILVRDNQDLVATNYYTEQTGSLLQASGDGAYPGQPGHITIQGTELQLDDPNCIRINDYEGRVGIFSGQFLGRVGASGAPFPYGPGAGATGYSISQAGSRPVDLLLLGNMFWNHDPTFTGDPGLNLSLIQNVVYGDAVTNGPPHPVTNLLPGVSSDILTALVKPGSNNPAQSSPAVTAGLSDAVAALDDFRQLGAVDLALNHP